MLPDEVLAVDELLRHARIAATLAALHSPRLSETSRHPQHATTENGAHCYTTHCTWSVASHAARKALHAVEALNRAVRELHHLPAQQPCMLAEDVHGSEREGGSLAIVGPLTFTDV